MDIPESGRNGDATDTTAAATRQRQRQRRHVQPWQQRAPGDRLFAVSMAALRLYSYAVATSASRSAAAASGGSRGTALVLASTAALLLLTFLPGRSYERVWRRWAAAAYRLLVFTHFPTVWQAAMARPPGRFLPDAALVLLGEWGERG